MKDSKFYKKVYGTKKNNNKTWITQLLITIIIILTCLIVNNLSKDDNLLKNWLERDLSFAKLNTYYQKFIGHKEDNDNKGDDMLTFNDTSTDEIPEKINNSYKIKMTNTNSINALKPGIIVYIGEKDDLGNTVIIQGNDGVDIWYSNITNVEYNLYDYIKEQTTIGVAKDDTMYLTFDKNGKYLSYEEYIA